MARGATTHRLLAYRAHALREGERALAQECAVALTFNGSTHAVLMATPCDLEDLGIGFALSEGIVASAADIAAVAVEETPLGFDVQMRVNEEAARRLQARRRAMAGPVGCGLCGVESLEAALRPVPVVPDGLKLAPADIRAAVAAFGNAQVLNGETRAVHGAALYRPAIGLLAIREDVGRHNALDKLIGHAARGGVATDDAAVVLSSRLSVELVQKCAVAGISAMIAVSAPSSLAVETAREAGILVVAVARGAEFDVFTGQERIITKGKADAA